MKVLTLGVLFCSLLSLACAQLVINELDVVSPGAQYSEFIEIKNTGSSAVNMDGYMLIINAWDSTNLFWYQVDNQTLVDFVLKPGAYHVSCVVPGLVPFCVQEITTSAAGETIYQDWLPDYEGYIVLVDPSGNVVDLVGYDQDVIGTPGVTSLGASTVGDVQNAEGVSISRVPDGVNTDNNNADFADRCATPGQANLADAYAISADDIPVCAPGSQSDLMINEVDYTQPGGDTKEFIELHNRADTSYDNSLGSQYTLDVLSSTNTTIWTIVVSSASYPMNVPQHGYWVLCASGSGICTGPGNRPIGSGTQKLPTAVDWLPNPSDVNPYYTIQLRKTGLGGGVVDALTYGGTAPGITFGTGLGNIDRQIESRFGISRWPDAYDTQNNAENYQTSCISPGETNLFDSVNCDPSNSPSPSPTNTPSPSNSPSNSPTNSPTRSPTSTPSNSPSVSPTPSPTNSPTQSPTQSPTNSPTNSPTKSPTNSPTKSPTNSPTRSPTQSPTQSPSSTPSASSSPSPTPSVSTSPSATPIRVPIPSALALCEKEKLEDAEKEAHLLAERKKFCRKLVPESERERDEEKAAMHHAYEEASQCWYTKATECPLERRSDAKLMMKELQVNMELHNKELDSIPKPKRGLARADKEETDEEQANGKAKRWDVLWDTLTDPYLENTEYSLDYCLKKREYTKFYLKALRYKIHACDETRAFFDCQRDAYTSFKNVYTASNTECAAYSCA